MNDICRHKCLPSQQCQNSLVGVNTIKITKTNKMAKTKTIVFFDCPEELRNLEKLKQKSAKLLIFLVLQKLTHIALKTTSHN